MGTQRHGALYLNENLQLSYLTVVRKMLFILPILEYPLAIQPDGDTDMIRLVFALRKKPNLTREEFQEYWLTQHAPLVASFATDLNIHRYVQTHTLNDPANEAAQEARGEKFEVRNEK